MVFEQSLLYETRHGLSNISSMHTIVIGIGGVVMALDTGKKFPDD